MSGNRAAADISKVRKDRSVHSTASRDDRSVIVLYCIVLYCIVFYIVLCYIKLYYVILLYFNCVVLH